jgi:hypothetical protein
MSLSLLMALIEPWQDYQVSDSDPGPEFESEVKNWIETAKEREELMLQALYQALNEVLYDQATIDPEARGFIQGVRDTEKTRKPQPGRAIGTLLAQRVSNHPEAHPLAQVDILALRQKLRHELKTHLDRLKKQVEPGSYGAGSLSST